MNEDLEKGSVLPFIQKAQKNNLSVLVMNPNYNRDPISKVRKLIFEIVNRQLFLIVIQWKLMLSLSGRNM